MLSPATSSSALRELLTVLEKPRGASLKAFTETSTWGPTLAGSPSPRDDFANTETRIIVNGIAFTEAEAPSCDQTTREGTQTALSQVFDTTGQVPPPGMKLRVTGTLWEDEGTL